MKGRFRQSGTTIVPQASRRGMEIGAPRFQHRPPALVLTEDQVNGPPSGIHSIVQTELEEMSPILDQVTLIVYGWQSVEPGTLWWVFPSMATALAAARAMTNAVGWAIVAGTRGGEVDVARERARGTVLVEQPG